MMLESILSALIGFAIIVALHLAITNYRWRKLKRHVIEAIEALNLWDTVSTHVPLPCDAFRKIITFLNAHNYNHCFNEQGGCIQAVLYAW